MKSNKWFKLPKPKPGEIICPLCHLNEADESPQGCHCWDDATQQDAPDGAKRRLTGRNGKPTNVLADGSLDPAPPVI